MHYSLSRIAHNFSKFLNYDIYCEFLYYDFSIDSAYEIFVGKPRIRFSSRGSGVLKEGFVMRLEDLAT
jgi:hypothetical protein